jgi:hypothetical protein
MGNHRVFRRPADPANPEGHATPPRARDHPTRAHRFPSDAPCGSATGGATFIFSVTCFAYGMMISALRGSTLDCTFRLNLKRFLPFQGEH